MPLVLEANKGKKAHFMRKNTEKTKKKRKKCLNGLTTTWLIFWVLAAGLVLAFPEQACAKNRGKQQQSAAPANWGSGWKNAGSDNKANYYQKGIETRALYHNNSTGYSSKLDTKGWGNWSFINNQNNTRRDYDSNTGKWGTATQLGPTIIYSPQQKGPGIRVPSIDFSPKLKERIEPGNHIHAHISDPGGITNNWKPDIKLGGPHSRVILHDSILHGAKINVSGTGSFDAYNVRGRNMHINFNDNVRVGRVFDSFNGATVIDRSIGGNAFRYTEVRNSFNRANFGNLGGNAFRNAQIYNSFNNASFGSVAGNAFRQAQIHNSFNNASFGSIAGNAFRNAKGYGNMFQQAKFGNITDNAFRNTVMGDRAFQGAQFLGRIDRNAFAKASLGADSFQRADFSKATIAGNAFKQTLDNQAKSITKETYGPLLGSIDSPVKQALNKQSMVPSDNTVEKLD